MVFSLERAFPTPARRDEITTQIINVLLAQYLPFKVTESLIGRLIYAYNTVPLGRFHMRHLQLAFIQQVRHGRHLYLPVQVSRTIFDGGYRTEYGRKAYSFNPVRYN